MRGSVDEARGPVSGPAATPPPEAVRLAELVAALSLVADLGLGHPMEHILRQTVIAMRLAEAAGLSPEHRAATYYTSLLAWVGCAADTHDLAALFGDESQLYIGGYDVDFAGVPAATFLLGHLGSGRSTVQRIGLISQFFATGGRSLQRALQNHCLAAGDLADRFNLGPQVRLPLLQTFERWDGRGTPGEAAGEGLAPAIRVVHLADTVEQFHRVGGPTAVASVVRERRGTRFDPVLVDDLLGSLDAIVDDLDDLSSWDEVIALDPSLGTTLTDDGLDLALQAIGDFADLKCPMRVGHSRGVTALASEAGRQLGLTDDDLRLLSRAAAVHDAGVIGVQAGVWDEPGPWSVSQREHARTHPYLVQRMLSRPPALAAVGRIASLHHERLDGSGYPSGLQADALPMTARTLAAADVYDALLHDRPHRPALSRDDARAIVTAEVRAGRLDGDAVNAVLAADGHRVSRRAELPGGLTPREAEVVVLLATGSSNREIAETLSISRKTVSAHLEHVYTKLGVSSRTEAALFAMSHGLVGRR